MDDMVSDKIKLDELTKKVARDDILLRDYVLNGLRQMSYIEPKNEIYTIEIAWRNEPVILHFHQAVNMKYVADQFMIFIRQIEDGINQKAKSEKAAE